MIATWGKNVYVKLPVTNTRGEPLFEAVRALSREGIKINMTAIFTRRAGRHARWMRWPAARRPASRCSPGGSPISASTTGRSCGTRSPAPRKTPNVEIIWASTREVFNVVEADEMGCHIITAPADVLKKLPAMGTKSAAELSLGAVEAFREDALSAGLALDAGSAGQGAQAAADDAALAATGISVL